jgi:Na+/melibiose symporter and related transporters
MWIGGRFVPFLQYNTVGGLIFYAILRFFASMPTGIGLVLGISMIADHIDQKEMQTGERLEGTFYSVKSFINKVAIALFTGFPILILEAFGYNAKIMSELTSVEISGELVPYMGKLIINPNIPNIIGGVDYTMVLNAIFFISSAAVGVVCILQAIPMIFYKVDEKKLELQLADFRKEKEERQARELEELYRQQNGLTDEITTENIEESKEEITTDTVENGEEISDVYSVENAKENVGRECVEQIITQESDNTTT